jgi:hypothetical protein
MIIKIAYLMYDVILHNTAMQYQIYLPLMTHQHLSRHNALK